MNSAMELSKLLGKQGLYGQHGIVFDVVVKDIKTSYGNVRYLIEPVAGKGQVWINADSLTFKS